MAGIKPPSVAKGPDLATWQAVCPEFAPAPFPAPRSGMTAKAQHASDLDLHQSGDAAATNRMV